ncbi:hypothetical protein H0H93_009265 [Arthromyces matolae]|nr:hypothetical protein H0H93_009265 [Arthromyces matolae]
MFESTKTLYRRKGGGGAKGGSEGGTSSSSSKSSSSSSESSSSSTGHSTISVTGTSSKATPYGVGGGKSTTIAAGQLFAGRESGGGTRAQVYGTSQYGSGYPGSSQRGVAGLGFPFVFWPVVWGGAGGFGTEAYLHTSEYGRPDNSSRPGGPLTTAIFVSSANSNTTFRLLADNQTAISLVADIQSSCGSDLNNSTSVFVPASYNDSFSSLPQPEQTVQYYRASTVALTLDGYNNTAVFEDQGTPDVSLPSDIDTTLLSCLNSTIGAAVPLVGGASSLPVPSIGVLGGVYVLWLLSTIF